MIVPRLERIGLAIVTVIALALAIGLVLTRSKLATARTDHAASDAANRETVALHRIAAARTELQMANNLIRVATAQDAISKELSDDYQARLDDARARAAALRMSLDQAKVRAGAGRADGDPLPGLSDPAGGADRAAEAGGFSVAERLIATEQAIQLDALIEWVERQGEVAVEAVPEDGG